MARKLNSLQSQQVARRYSEFESLRHVLGRLYPTLIIPPIPSKHSIGEYANKSKEETKIVTARKTTLQDFLSRIAKHPILGREHFFHKFLSAEISWKHVLNSPPISKLPRNPLHVSSNDPTNDKNVAAYASLPTPSPSQPLRRPDQRFLDSEMFTAKFAQHFESSLERVDRRTTKRWSGIANDYAELGAVFNGFGLTESDTLAAALEKIGQAVDSTYISTNAMLQAWEKDFSKPIHIYSQFAHIIKKLLEYRHQKHAQHEMLIDALGAKREHLVELERSEQEAQRLDAALSKGLSSTKLLDEPQQDQEQLQDNNNNENSPNEQEDMPSQSILTDNSSREVKKQKSNLSFLGAISHTLQGIMDADPEATRRNSIGKTRESIQGLESALEASTYDVSYTSQTIQADLDRFQRQKVADIREMLFAPKGKKKVGPSAPFKPPGSSKVESISLEQVKDYRNQHNHIAKRKPQRQASPNTDSDEDAQTRQQLIPEKSVAMRNLKQKGPIDFTPDNSFSAASTCSPSKSPPVSRKNRYNNNLKKSNLNKKFSFSPEAETPVEERPARQRNRTNFLLDDITGVSTQSSASPEKEESISPPFQYELRDSGSESPPSLDDAILAPSASKVRKSSLDSLSPIRKKISDSLNKSPKFAKNQIGKKRRESVDKKELDMKELSPKKKKGDKQSRKEKETGDAKKIEPHNTKINVSRSANYEDDEGEPTPKKRRGNNNIQNSTNEDVNENSIEVSNPLASKPKAKKLQRIIVANTKKPSVDPVEQSQKDGLFKECDVINSYITSVSQEEQQKSPKSSGARNRAIATAVRLSEDEDADGDVVQGKKKATTSSQPHPKKESILLSGDKRPKPKPKARAAKQQNHSNQSNIPAFFKPTVKPSDIQLCPVCDNKLPHLRTQHLKTILKEFLNVAKLSPRTSNPYGMKAHVVAESELCTAHELDTKVIPEGQKKGYPIEHDWNRVSDRIMKLSKKIKVVIKYKESSRFWIKAREDYAKVGSKKANGLDVQFENFEDEQPGYYGEIGLMVISFTLNALSTSKPKSKIKLNQSLTNPLSPKDFIRRVLVPEVANLLIAQDRGVSTEIAEEIRRDSREYGNAVFSADMEDIAWRPQLPTDLISDSE
ncbi:hypothetical protein E3P77_00697 [Wallemia ichthyophaga]|nr:hypothetical protein E3P77_00697 [Wallemia ichthyophaga]